MKIIIPGGSGQVGAILARAFGSEGHEIVVLSRTATSAPWRVAQWDARTLGEWANEFDGADVVINLAGRSVNCRYNAENRQMIKQSRIDSTHVIGEAIARCERPPRVWLQASTATIYADRYDAPNDEATGIIGGAEPNVPDTWRFSIDVATSWERALDECVTPHTRKVKLRSAMIMSPDQGGIFDTILTLVRRGLGGRAGHGRQYVSWVHYVDFVRAIAWLIEHDDIDDIVNIASPNPLPYNDFVGALRKAWGIKIGLPATAWMIEIGAWLMRTESELVMKSRRVVPRRLLDAGFDFTYNTWPEASRELCDEVKAGRR